jgi:hypothetical protein
MIRAGAARRQQKQAQPLVPVAQVAQREAAMDARQVISR